MEPRATSNYNFVQLIVLYEIIVRCYTWLDVTIETLITEQNNGFFFHDIHVNDIQIIVKKYILYSIKVL